MDSIINKFEQFTLMAAIASAINVPSSGYKRSKPLAKSPLTKKQKKVRAKNKQQRISRKINRLKRA